MSRTPAQRDQAIARVAAGTATDDEKRYVERTASNGNPGRGITAVARKALDEGKKK